MAALLPRLITFALAALASIIGLDPELHDPALWFGSEAVLAGVVIAAVAFIRKGSDLQGFAAIFLSMAVGAGLSIAGYFGELFATGTSLIQALLFGVGAGGGASAIFDGFKAVFGPKPQEPAG